MGLDKELMRDVISGFQKRAFVPMPGGAPMDPAMGGAPMDPAMGGAPMDPAMGGAPMDPAMGGAPMDPAMGGAPMDPAMGGAPMDPAMMAALAGEMGGEAAPAAGQITMSVPEFIDLVATLRGEPQPGREEEEKPKAKATLSDLSQRLAALESALMPGATPPMM